MLNMHFTTGNLNTKTNTNITMLLKKRREKFVLIRGFAFQKIMK